MVLSAMRSATIVLDGEIDIATSPAMVEFLAAAIRGGQVRLTVDMRAVTFIDASGIGVLVAAANRVREAGGDLLLYAPSCQVWRVLAILGLDAHLRALRLQVAA